MVSECLVVLNPAQDINLGDMDPLRTDKASSCSQHSKQLSLGLGKKD